MCNTLAHPFFQMYRVQPELKPFKYVVESFSFNENEHYFLVEMALETDSEGCEVIMPKSYVNQWFKSQYPRTVEAYSYKEEGEKHIGWDDLYMEQFDVDCKLISRVFNDYMNDDKFKNR